MTFNRLPVKFKASLKAFLIIWTVSVDKYPSSKSNPCECESCNTQFYSTFFHYWLSKLTVLICGLMIT